MDKGVGSDVSETVRLQIEIACVLTKYRLVLNQKGNLKMTKGEQLIRRIYPLAKKNLETDGHLRAVVFVDGVGGMLMFDVNECMASDNAKDEIASIVKKAVEALEASAVLFLTEAWYYINPDPDINFEDQVAPSQHPERKEAVFLQYESASECLSGRANILRGPDGRPKLCDLVIYPVEAKRGRFSNLLRKDKNHGN